MRIQIFSKYYNLAQAGRVKPLACVMHQEEPDLTYELIHKDEDGQIVLQCLACGARVIPSQRLYEEMIKDIKNATT
jgi:hypothetical protein